MRHGSLLGRTFDKWTVINNRGSKKNSALCRCECGCEKSVKRSNLLNGTSRSCGCNRVNTLKSIYLEKCMDGLL